MSYEIECIRDATDCRELIECDLGEPLKMFGEFWTWACPFHAEKSPGAFRANRVCYRCFSCGASGDIFTWMTEFRKLDFRAALEALGSGNFGGLDPQARLARAAEIAEKAARELEQKIKQAQEALAELRTAQRWVQYHDQLTEAAKQQWLKAGLDQFYIDWWQLGYCEDFTVWYWQQGESISWQSPTLTIPVWSPGWEVGNLKHRLLNPAPDGTKYWPERKHIPSASFYCNPDNSRGACLVTEGEKKAMVTFKALDSADIQVVGLPSATPDETLFKSLDGYNPIWINLDPDAWNLPKNGKVTPIERAVEMLGRERARVIRLPMKIDDAIIRRCLDKGGLRRLMANATTMRKD